MLGGFSVALLLHLTKSDDKNVQEMFKKCSTDQRNMKFRKKNCRFRIREKTCGELFKRLMEEERRRQMKDMMMMASSPTQIQVIFLIILSDSYGNENLSPMSS